MKRQKVRCILSVILCMVLILSHGIPFAYANNLPVAAEAAAIEQGMPNGNGTVVEEEPADEDGTAVEEEPADEDGTAVEEEPADEDGTAVEEEPAGEDGTTVEEPIEGEITVPEIKTNINLTQNINDGVTSWYLNNTTSAAFTISTEGELRYLAKLVNGTAADGAGVSIGPVDFSGKTITLADDIELTKKWIPIGQNGESGFAGVFDGNGKTISGLSLAADVAEELAGNEYYGLFGYLSAEGAVRNLNITLAENLDDGETYWYLKDPGATNFSISKEAELRYLAQLVNGTATDGTGTVINPVSFAGTTITLTNDITLTEEWTPIGCDGETPFGGTFDGNGKTISGLILVAQPSLMRAAVQEAAADPYLGLFGQLSTAAQIQNLTVILAEPAGDGTAWYLDNPGADSFTISTEVELRYLAQLVNGTAVDGSGTVIPAVSFVNKTITLDEDMTLTEVWTPIGSSEETGFGGTFNGGGKTVSGLSLAADVEEEVAGNAYHGLFGYLSTEGVVQNLNIVPANDGVTYWYLKDPKAVSFSISNEAELRYLAQLVNGTAVDGEGTAIPAVSFSSKTITLTDDITLTEAWTPIGGGETTGFGGTFDGTGKAIRGLSITGSNTYQGLFGYAAGATIQNLTAAGSITAADSSAGIVGFLSAGTLKDCQNEVNVTGMNNVGGIVGYLDNLKEVEISSCSNRGAITGNDFVGGIVGNAQEAGASTISQCTNSGGVSGANNLGGIAGAIGGAVVLVKSLNIADIEGSGQAVGGIAGKQVNATIQNCGNLGKTEGATAVGSLVGQAEGTAAVENSFSYLEGDSNPLCGGEAVITNSFYLAAGEEDTSEQARSREAFKYGEVAYLLDGGAGTHNDVWTQGSDYPVLGTGSVYKLTLVQPEPPCEQGTVTFAELAEDSSYKLFPGDDGREYTYLPGGATLELKVELNSEIPGVSEYQPAFYPARAVEKQEGEGDAADKYLARTIEQDVELTYRFWKQEDSNIGWYLAGSSDPYRITTEGELLGLAELVNGTAKDGAGTAIGPVDFMGKTIELADNITVTGKWTPIGNGNQFKGTFDGQDHEIYYELGDDAAPAAGTYLGLFGYTNGAVIKNLTVDGQLYAGSQSQYVGGIVGWATGTSSAKGSIIDCTFVGLVNAQTTIPASGYGGIGGLAGQVNYTDITNGTNEGNVIGEVLINSRGKGGIGGIAGYAENGDISAGNKGTVEGNSGSGTAGGVGGIIGNSGKGITTTGCVNDVMGVVNGTGAGVGGITGRSASAITGINKGNVIGTGDDVGGLSGNATAEISGGRNEGSVTGEGNNVGGIAGSTTKAITNGVNQGTVAGGSYVGGIAGNTTYNNTGAITQSMNEGSVTGTGINVGGIAGGATGTIKGSYNLEEEISGSSGVGSILGGANGINSKVNGCFSYTTPATGLALTGGDASILNSCYLASEESIYGLPEEAFIYGKAAWLLDGGQGTHSNLWTQGPDYPVWGDGSDTFYRLNLIQPDESSPGGTVALGAIQSADEKYTNWLLFNEGGGGSYYLPGGLSVALEVQRSGGAEDYQLIFTPAGKVTVAGENYTVAIANENISLSYEFLETGGSPVGGAWYNNGAGVDNKFIIQTENDLRYLARLVAGTAINNSGEEVTDSFENKTVELGQDIVLSKDWSPIGTSGKPFKGTFMGNQHTISALAIVSSDAYPGLFGYTSGGAIKELAVGGSVVSGGDYSGGIVGYASGTELTDCRFVSVPEAEPSRVSGRNYVGGIAGYATGTVSGCASEGTIAGAGYAGGIAGCIDYSSGMELKDCTNTGAVTGNSYVGGISGYLKGTSGGGRLVKNVTNSGNITGSVQYVGGIAGYAEVKYSIEQSVNSGTVEAQGAAADQSVGGLVGLLMSSVSDCANTGNVTGTTQNVGGIAGRHRSDNDIKKSYNSGSISGGTRVGGIVGGAERPIENCYNLGDISGSSDVGGIVGNSSIKNTVKYCFSLSDQLMGNDVVPYCSYYLVSEDSTDPSEFAKKAETFQYGEVAWMLDSPQAQDAKVWTQGEGHPVLKGEGTTGSVYKLTLEKVAGSNEEAGTVELAEPPAGSSYKLFEPEGGSPYTYVPAGTEIQLNALRNAGYEHYWLEFTPEGCVSWSAEEEDKVVYQAVVPEADTTITWRFSLPVESSTDWYYANPNPSDNTFSIRTYPDLLGLAELVKGQKLDGTAVETVDFGGKTIRLSGDIEVTSGYAPIGTAEKPFTGVFDGAGYTISGLAVATPENYQGLFGYILGGTVKNLTLKGSIKGGDYVGGIVGYAKDAVISDCRLAADESGAGQVSGQRYVGGIAGYLTGSATITGSGNAARVGGSSYVGGIIGQGESESKLSDCTNEGEISGGPATGGIAGGMKGTIKNCTNAGSVAGEGSSGSNAGVGGIVGSLDSKGEVSDSLNRGTVSADDLYAGGISGNLQGRVIRSGNTGTISGGKSVGGIAGRNDSGTVSYSYNRGQINNSGLITDEVKGARIGGITGENKSQAVVKYCYNYGTFSGTTAQVGAITNTEGYGNNTNCYYSSEKWPGTPIDENYVTDKSQAAFASGEVAWLLDGGKELLRKGLWSQERTEEDGYPILANDSHGVIFKVGLEENSQGVLNLVSSYEYFNAGERVTVVAAPASGYMLKEISVDGGYKIEGSRTDRADGSIALEFTMPETDVTVSAQFVPSQTGAHTVTFDANGGSFGVESSRIAEVSAGQAVERPEAPTWSGKVFRGWFTEAAGGEKYDFNRSVTEDITLYAQWKTEGQVIITFDANGGRMDGEEVAEVTIAAGQTVSEPEPPQWDDGTSVSYTFTGWFTQRSGGEEWDFAASVEDDLNLYAQWNKENGFATGTEDHPYVIDSASVLKELADSVNNGESYADNWFELGDNIELDESWAGIGDTVGKAFQGHFDGNGNTITLRGAQAPLFLNVGSNAKVTNIRLDGDLEVTGDNMGTVAANNYGEISGIISSVDFSENTRSNIGGIIGTNYGDVKECVNHGEIYGRQNVGGIIGYHAGVSSKKAEGCQNDGTIVGQAAAGESIEGIGGLIGAILNGMEIIGAGNTGAISVTGSNVNGIGGIVGLGPMNSSTEISITGSRNEGDITVTGSGEHIGGLIGETRWIDSLERCSNEGTITAESAKNVGGLVGLVKESVVNGLDSYNEGAITGGNGFVGGLIGSGSDSNLTNCYNTGTITGHSQIGGLIGINKGGELTNCYNTGEVEAGGGDVGGLVGSFTFMLTSDGNYAALNCYSTGSVTGSTNVGGLIGSASDRDNNGIINSFWYGPSLTATAGDGVVNGISNAVSEYNQNNYYAAASQTGISDANDGNSSTLKTAEQFASGEVAYLLDTGNDGSEELPKSWTQDDAAGRPDLGQPSYCKITVDGNDNGTVTVRSERSGYGEEYALGDPETPIYAAVGSTITVTAQAKNSETVGKTTYTYTLERITVGQDGSAADIPASGQFEVNSDAVVTAVITEEQKDLQEEEHDDEDGNGDGNGNGNGDGNGNGNGNGDGNGNGNGNGDGNGNGNGNGDGNGNGEIIDNGHGGTGETTTTEEIAAPSTEGQATDQPVTIAQMADVTQSQQGDTETNQEEEAPQEPAGGGLEDQKEDPQDQEKEQEEQLILFEIVKKVVQENPVTSAIVTALILGILLSAGYRRYKKQIGDR